MRKLANNSEVRPESVLYVFPRITKHEDLCENIGNLLSVTSFVPVLEIDKQASNQSSPIEIIDGVSHKYRTSYDGNTSEVNYYYYYYYYDQNIISEIVSELICLQVERLFLLIKKTEKIFAPDIELLINSIKNRIGESYKSYDQRLVNTEKIIAYLNEFKITDFNISNFVIPKSIQKYTTEIPKEGVQIKFDKKNDLSNITYQII